jgi:hypothetical protein
LATIAKEGTFDGKVDFTVGEGLRDDLANTEPLPDGLKDIDRPIRPGINQAPRGCLLNNLFGDTSLEDTAGQLAQAHSALGIIRPPTIVDNVNFGALFEGIPYALGQLKMDDEGAIGSFLTGFA